MMDKLIRTDKNGTEYWADYTCRRCGGAGGADQWTYTGWTCYECGGSGLAAKPHIYKKYTPEYEAVLAQRRAKREEKRRQERTQKFRENIEQVYAEYGFNADGKIFAVVAENTYNIKDELREAGARWCVQIRRWVFTEKPEQWDTVEVSFDDLHWFNDATGRVEYKEGAEEAFTAKLPKPDVKESHYIGEVGKRIEKQVTLKALRWWDAKDPWGRPFTMWLYSFVDADGNVIVWKTSGCGIDPQEHPEGSELTIRATVKEHSEYKDVKQTVVQRVKAM